MIDNRGDPDRTAVHSQNANAFPDVGKSRCPEHNREVHNVR